MKTGACKSRPDFSFTRSVVNRPVPSLSPHPACAPTDLDSARDTSPRVGNQGSASEEQREGFRLWGKATTALMDRVDIVRDLDQRRLAASRYGQRLQVHQCRVSRGSPLVFIA